MLRQYNFEQKQALIALFIFNVPLESSDGEVDIEYSSCNSWRDHAITSLTEFLCVPDWTTNQIAPLLATDYALSKQGWVDREQRSKPYSTVLDCRRESSLLIYASLLIHLVQTKQFDGRGSVLMRNLVKAFGMTEDDGIFLESQLSTFLVQKYQELAHSNEKTKDSFRYAKIGAAAVGAGALLFFTAGLAAPAVAGALVILGTSSIAAAGIAGGMVLIFGGTGAGLAGYKMKTRTKGLSDFQFQQYYEKDKMEVIIMVSGWMEEDEDDKRTFGVVPDEMSLLERLRRFYHMHDPSRLNKAPNEAECFQDDPTDLFDQIKEQYDKDPMDVASFIPPVRSVSGATTAAAAGAAPGAGTGVGVGAERGKGPGPSSSITAAVAAAAADKPLEKNEYLDAITACFENLAVEVARLESAGGTSGPTTSTSASAFDERPHHTRDCKPSSSPTVVPALPPRDSRDKLSDGGVPLATVVPATTTDGASSSGGEPELDSAQIEALNVQLQSIKAEEVKDKDIHLYDQFQYWHWNELKVSPLYELNLLHWEKALQKDLGKSILNLVKFLSGYAAEVALQYTLLSALVAAIALPVIMIQMTHAIDNIWLIAAERATEAGKELAKALLERPHGKRPVTLVGYSIGCRVIFSCLKELAKRMEELEKEPYADIPVATPAPAEEEDEEELPVRISSPAALDTTRVTSPSPSVVAQNTAQGSRAPSASASRTSASASTRTSASGGGGGYFSFGNFFGPAADSAAGDAGGGLSGEKGAPAAAVATDATTEASQSASGTGTKDGVAAEVAPEGPVRTVRDIKSMIKDVVLLGAPLNLKSKSWAKIREVVAGRLINGYSTSDMVLSVVYRYERYKVSVSGIAPVKVRGIENVNLTHIVTQHIHYCTKMKEILEEINLGSSYPHESAFDVFEQK